VSEIGEIHLSRVYDREPAAGSAFLVERLWPRGVRREELGTYIWLKDVAPSTGLRTWFGHDPSKWAAFQRCYTSELDANPAGWQPLADAARAGNITLLYSSRDRDHNNAVVLREYLQRRIQND
jgi:uncharacterized protein YeaO (DUF488 family)